MNKLLLILAFASLLSCHSPILPDDAATGVLGRYIVTAYVVSGDTLFSTIPTSTGYKPGINKIGVDDFAVVINRTGANQISVNTSYWRNGSRPTSTKDVLVRQTTYQYYLSPIQDLTPSVYEGRIERNKKIFYERTMDGGLLIPIANSPTNPNQPSPRDVIIVAQPQL